MTLGHVFPIVNNYVLADLGGERLRVVVQQVLDEDRILASIPIATLGKSHSHRINDVLLFRRESDGLGDIWMVVTDAQRAAEAARKEAAHKEAAKAKGRATAANRAKSKSHPEKKVKHAARSR